MQAVGINTYIWNNNIKSILLLCAFPFLFFLMDFLFFAGTAALSPMPDNVDPTPIIIQQGLTGLAHTWAWVVGGVGIWFIIAYFMHGTIIRAATHSKPLSRSEAPDLYNILENLCISRGMPMPALYIIETPVMNAFASGIDTTSFAITVTRGLLNTLNPAELQAVLGHELTHIINRDVRLLIVSIIFVGIISFLSNMAVRNMLYGMNRRSRENNNAGIAVIVGMVVLAIGYVLAILIRFALSRRREFLADAGSVTLTKDPDAMISALMKISQNAEMPGVSSEVKAMFIENPPSADFMGMFATHPPIQDRIAALRKYAE
ncbi:MAG: M48 family metallopeptidase [Gammaproteobacteria bacterium]